MTEPAANRFNARAALAFCIVGAALLAVGSDRIRGLIANAALLAAGTMAIAIPIGIILGAAIAKVETPGRRWLAWIMIALLFVPLYVQAAAWYTVLGPGGWATRPLTGQPYARPWLEGWRGAIWIHAMGAVPWAALLTAASLTSVERRLEEESLLDASPLRVLWRVSLRRGLGGVAAAAVWIAVACATEITVTDLFQVRTFAEEVYTEASLGPLLGGPASFEAKDLAIGLGILAIVAAAAIWLGARWLPAAAIAADGGWRWRPLRGRVALGIAVWMLAAVVVVVPLTGLVWKAGVDVQRTDAGYARSWSAIKAATLVAHSPWEHRREWGWSLAIGVMAAAAATVAALLMAWTARERRWAATPLVAFIACCLAVPGPLWGVWTIAALNQAPGSPWSVLTTLYDRTLLAPTLVQAVRALPLVALWLWSQLRSVPEELLDAARSEGAGSLVRLWRVALPLRRTGVATAALLALALAMAELSATLLVTPPGVTTLSVRVFQLLHYGVDDRVAALSLAIFLVVGASVALASLLARTGRRRVRDVQVR